MNPEYGPPQGALSSLARNRTLGHLAKLIQPKLQALLEGGDARHRTIKNLLHGTFLGHPLHPPLTDIPIGAWSVAAVCDALELTGTDRFRTTADVAIAVGATGAVGAAVTGLADWSDTKDAPARLGMLHAILNSAALANYLVSLIARRNGARRFGIVAAFAGYGLMSLAGYIGGELSFGLQLGVKHTAVPIDPPADFTAVLAASELSGDRMHAANANGIALLVTHAAGAVHAVGGACTHRGAPLADGTQDGTCVRCPWHGSRFSLQDGGVLEGPATFALAAFETRTAEGKIEVRAAG